MSKAVTPQLAKECRDKADLDIIEEAVEMLNQLLVKGNTFGSGSLAYSMVNYKASITEAVIKRFRDAGWTIDTQDGGWLLIFRESIE